MAPRASIPITVITGFVGVGKTTLILNLLPQLRKANPSYKLALIKNEIGDLNVDSALASAAEITGSRELLGACICCTNVGQIGESLAQLDDEYSPDRIVIETSGSAEPIKLVLEIRRLSEENDGRYEVDGVVSVVDVVNWGGYASTSYTAKLQAKQTDVIVLNKWEEAGEDRTDRVLDMLGDMDVDTPIVRSDKGWVSKDLLFGLDSKMVAGEWKRSNGHDHGHSHDHGDGHDHNEEMECLSITLTGGSEVDGAKLMQLLETAPKDEVYRIKAILNSKQAPQGVEKPDGHARYILNWSFGRYTWTVDTSGYQQEDPLLRMSIFTARYESNKWQKRIESGKFIAVQGAKEGETEGLSVKRVL